MDKGVAIERFRRLIVDFDHLTGESGEYAWLHQAPRSEQYKDLYLEHLTEPIDLAFAGVFSAIAREGHCDYIFLENRICGVGTPEELLRDSLAFAAHYRKAVTAIVPRTGAEEADYKDLMRQADIVEEMAHLAYELIKDRSAVPGK